MWVPWFLEVKLSAGLGLLGARKGAETYGTNQEDPKLRGGLLLATARTIGDSDSTLPRACALTKEDGYMDNKLVVCGGAGSRVRGQAGREALPSSVPPCGVQNGPAYCVCLAAQLSPGLRVLCVYHHGSIPLHPTCLSCCRMCGGCSSFNAVWPLWRQVPTLKLKEGTSPHYSTSH